MRLKPKTTQAMGFTVAAPSAKPAGMAGSRPRSKHSQRGRGGTPKSAPLSGLSATSSSRVPSQTKRWRHATSSSRTDKHRLHPHADAQHFIDTLQTGTARFAQMLDQFQLSASQRCRFQTIANSPLGLASWASSLASANIIRRKDDNLTKRPIHGHGPCRSPYPSPASHVWRKVHLCFHAGQGHTKHSLSVTGKFIDCRANSQRIISFFPDAIHILKANLCQNRRTARTEEQPTVRHVPTASCSASPWQVVHGYPISQITINSPTWQRNHDRATRVSQFKLGELGITQRQVVPLRIRFRR